MATNSSTIIPPEDSPAFFKVFLPTSTLHMSLPPGFVRRHLRKIPRKPILKTATGEHSWRLEIKKINGDYCFALGWEMVVKDCNLGFGDFLVFRLIDSSTFIVYIFHKDGCERDPNWSRESERALNVDNAINIDGDDDDGDEDDDDDYGDDDNDDDEEEEEKEEEEEDDGDDDDEEEEEEEEEEDPCFERAISEKTHKHNMRLPRQFAEEAGITSKSVVTVRDPYGKEWLLGLHVEETKFPIYSLSTGWSIFREYNKLSDGDVCSFKFVREEGILALTQVIKNKSTKKQERSENGTPKVEGVKRKRGRPPREKPRGGGGGGGGGGGVKIEDKTSLEVEVVVKRKPGRPPFRKNRDGILGGGGGGVKIEDESGLEVEAVKRKRGRPPLRKNHDGRVNGNGGGGVVKIVNESSPEVEVVKRKRGRPPLRETLDGRRGNNVSGGVKVVEESSREVEVVKRGRGRPPFKKNHDDGKGGNSGGGVKIEDDLGPEVEVVKRKRGRPPLKRHDDSGGGGGVVEVKVEDELTSDVEAAKKKRGRPSLQKPCEDVSTPKIGESCHDEKFTRSNNVIYF